jgi:hypothetical protein
VEIIIINHKIKITLGGGKDNDGGVNAITTYCKNFCKCHSVPLSPTTTTTLTTLKMSA